MNLPIFNLPLIIHQLSCPYTPKQNGIVERCHRTIQELGMTMFFHSGVPKCFWVEAFITATFLINGRPTTTFDLQSLFSTLYGTYPNYRSLHVFGSKCYPYTRNTKHNKFDPKTLQCVFLGHNN